MPYATLKVLRDHGLRLLLVGYESGNQHILNNIKKGIRLDIARQFTKDAKALGIAFRARQTLDVVRRIAVVRGLGDALERLLDLVEAQEVRVPERGLARHERSPRLAALR